MSCLKSILFVCLLVLSVSDAVARRLQQQLAAQQLEAPQVEQLAPVQIGDGSERIITRRSVQMQGGAMKALGTAVLQDLKRKSRFRGSVRDLARQINTDPDLAIDAVNKALMYACEGLTAKSEVAGGIAPSVLDSTITVDQAFALSSRPTSTKKIFLDFDGHTTTGTNWNNAFGTIVSKPYNRDGIDGFSPSELSDIVAIWRAVSEDYAMFDVDVTTADPGAAALASNGVRVVISGSSMDWYGSQVGGVAYMSSFGKPEPAFVFPQQLGPNSPKFIWEAVSHEVGHTLGLNHDGQNVNGVLTQTYYAGQGDWAPIMGSSYNRGVTTFDKGEFTGASNTQDDFAVIKTFLQPLPQQHGNSFATAAPLTATVAAGVATGSAMGAVVDAAGDWFTFTALAGTATLSAVTLSPSGTANRANLNIQLTVYDAAGAVVATLNPVGNLNVPATQVALATAGTYYVSVTGAGEGDVKSTGYSAYASLGQYELSVVYAPCTNCPAAPVVVQQPSPSPVPSPSPSPSPPPALSMRVGTVSASFVYTSSARTQLYCTVTVVIRNAAGQGVQGVKVSGRWALTAAGTTTVNTFTSYMTTTVAGSVSYRSSSLSATPGGNCVFTVSTVEAPGYTWDSVDSVLTRTVPW